MAIRLIHKRGQASRNRALGCQDSRGVNPQLELHLALARAKIHTCPQDSPVMAPLQRVPPNSDHQRCEFQLNLNG